MIQMHIEKKLLDEVFATYRDVQDAAAEMAQAYGLVDKVLASRRDLLAEKSE